MSNDIAAAIAAYRPYRLPQPVWDRIQDATRAALTAYRLRGTGVALSNIARPVVEFARWVADQPTRPDPAARLDVSELVGDGLVDRFILSLAGKAPDATRATYRSVLRRAVRNLDLNPQMPRLSYQAVQPPYSAAEVARMVRLAYNQPTVARRRVFLTMLALGVRHRAGRGTVVIGHDEVLRTREVVRRSGAAEQIEDLLRPVAAGRPRGLSAQTWLVGLMLAAAHAKSMTMTQVHRVLTREVSLSDQVLLGVRTRTSGGRFSDPVTLRQVRYIGCAIEARLAHTDARVGPDIPEEARAARAAALQGLADRLLAATMPTHINHQGHYAVDETGVWSWAIGRRRTDTTTGETEVLSADPDAAWGYKTAKVGEKETYFGYSVFAFARIPALGATTADAPVLTERLVVRPATNDITEPVLDAIDRLRAEGRPVAEIVADRAWSYRAAENWADELRARQIEHTFDLHENDNKVTDHDGMPVIARVAHCPALSQELKDIKRPAHLGKGAERDSFLTQIDQRAAYAMSPLTSRDANGNMRVQCPALAGKVICPLRALHPLAEDNDAPPCRGTSRGRGAAQVLHAAVGHHSRIRAAQAVAALHLGFAGVDRGLLPAHPHRGRVRQHEEPQHREPGPRMDAGRRAGQDHRHARRPRGSEQPAAAAQTGAARRRPHRPGHHPGPRRSVRPRRPPHRAGPGPRPTR